ncbi:MAG: acyl carrier protein [Nitrospirae bacterium]|nr:acyl carrier protein [Nitrospirota bacterium]MBF0592539.1 acyl carrier protein [Nitrospirota bacterium]
MSTLQRIKDMLLENFDFPEDKILPDTIIESFGLDSVDMIELIFYLEDEFEIKIPERDVKLVCIQDIIDVIERLIIEQHGTEIKNEQREVIK